MRYAYKRSGILFVKVVWMYVSTCLKDGLGNQLFYMAATYGYGRKHGRIPAIMLSTSPRCMNPHSYEQFENTVFGRFQKINIAADAVYREASENCLVYHEIPRANQGCHNFLLQGFFQNERYLEGFKEDFMRILHLPDVSAEAATWGPHDGLKNTCFVHVRRGDYLHTTKHNVDLMDYYRRAMQFVKKEWRAGGMAVRFLVFSDDIEWCRSCGHFAGSDVAFCTEKHDVKSMMLMSQCGVGGICANSTFSWWGAYLGFNSDKVVTFPDTWFNGVSWPNDIAFKGSVVLPITD